MSELEKKIGYEFGDFTLLEEALTHSSYANEHGLDRNLCNERLEFLGDSVLSLIVSEYLFSRNPKLPEGELTKIRAGLVCETALSKFANEIKLGESIKLGKGEIKNGGATRASILADCFEAVLAAMFLDGGIEPVRFFVLRFVKNELKRHESIRDYKTELQEVIQRNPEEKVKYVLVSENGPDHDKSFTVEVRLNSNVIGTGEGHSKKQAEQNAAKEALSLMGL
ncbi:MAG: ribonuclease III [Ruminococcaceae bacterium]|nr:ribonuclease III [Oscillospiraceae bacterium]